ncbi:phage terminase large subunit [Solirubrum puertoriconensis]|uniref:Terminase large subunit gp17-like C-terminal domain-containing protein n=1 Tax=Solirubrum puertoriconensis TaxID=1751427 RepID=A0A9X0L4H0_SOLP1|nr:phage terminase large subunit [Solirubrum puertoriconensis]KUG07432.1 hypothetical protein ASU33_13850 [Solirubrum puertoriconensis]
MSDITENLSNEPQVVEQHKPKNKGGRPRKVKPQVNPLAEDPDLLLNLQRVLYRKSYWEFFKAAFSYAEGQNFQEGAWYQRFLCDELQEVGLKLAQGLPRDRHLIVNIPPRSAKSYIFSVFFPVWLWLHNPSLRILTVTHTEGLAADLVSYSANIIKSGWFQRLYGQEFKLTTHNYAEIGNDKGGFRKAFGVNSDSITGNNADLVLCDDLMSSKMADSNAKREEAIQQFQKAIYTRLDNKQVGVIINIQQRLHVQDMTGFLLEKQPQRWRLIKLPSEAKSEHDVSPRDWFQYYDLDDSRDDGTRLIWDSPGRFSRDDLDEQKEMMGSRVYAQQHLQTPRDTEGGMFKADWMRPNIITQGEFEAKVNGRGLEWQLFVDGAETANPKNDATCYLLCARLDNQLFVKDVRWVRKEPADLVRDLVTYLRSYDLTTTPIRRCFIEKKSVGSSLLSLVKAQDVNTPVLPLDPAGVSKAGRALKAVPFVEGGRLWLLKGAWNDEFIDEVTAFTDGTGKGHDDALDALVYAILNARQSSFYYAVV